jgi:hypothetical protein
MCELADQLRHIRKKRLRDLSYMIRKTELRMRNKKAKRDIPRLEAKLHFLRNSYDQTLRGNIPGVVRKPVLPKVCIICNGKLGKGYHICKPPQLPRKEGQLKKDTTKAPTVQSVIG